MTNTLPEGYQVRPPVEADLESMHVVTEAYLLACYGESDFTLDDMRLSWSSPTFDPAEQGRLVFDSTGRLVVTAHFWQQAYMNYNIGLDVLPGHEDARIRAYLLSQGETWARQQMVQAPAEARIYLQCWIAGKDEEANRWYREQPDFAEVRRSWEMQIEMKEAPPAPVWPEGVTLRPFVPERDAQAVFEADNEFFRDHWGYLPMDYDRWRHWSVDRPDFDPSLWVIAYAGEQIVGVALPKDGEKGWINDVAVARAWRGKGLGLAMLYQAFGEFYRRGRYKVGLGVDAQSLTGATRLYERAGMHIAQEDIIYEKELRAGIDMSTQALEV
jgi:GNAT superfamily N-acetyltransferase